MEIGAEAVTGIATGDLRRRAEAVGLRDLLREYSQRSGIIEADVRSVDRAQLAIAARRIGEVINREKA